MDPTPTPIPEGIATMSVEQVTELERKVRENKQAQLRGDPPPHTITREEVRAAINGLRAMRGTMELAGTRTASGGKKGGTGKTQIDLVDLDGL